MILRGAIRTNAFAPRLVRHLAWTPPKLSGPEHPPPVSPTKAARPSLDIDHAGRTERTGAKSSADSLSSIEQRRRSLGRISLVLLAVALGVEVLYLGRDWEANELATKKTVRFFSSFLLSCSSTSSWLVQ